MRCVDAGSLYIGGRGGFFWVGGRRRRREGAASRRFGQVYWEPGRFEDADGGCTVRLRQFLHENIERHGVPMPVLRGSTITVITVSELDRVLALKPLPTQPFIPLPIPVVQIPHRLADLASALASSLEPKDMLEPQSPLAGRQELEDGIPFPSGAVDEVPVAAGGGEACHLGASVVFGVQVRMLGIWEGGATSFGSGDVALWTVDS